MPLVLQTQKHATTEVQIHSLRVEVIGGVDQGLVFTAASETCTIGSADGNDLVVHDPGVSRFHVELTRRSDGVLLVDHGSTNGTWLGAVRVSRAMVPPGTVIRLADTQLRITDGATTTEALPAGEGLAGMVGGSAAMRRLYARIERAAQTQASTLIIGESGVGKELVAKSIHELGPRRGKPFVVVDCGALTPTLVASELFGHERGAFTGADRRHIGAIERADGGTVFFDEIGELPASLQVTLLGVLQRRSFRRLGGRDEIGVDVRVVSATNRDLRSEVNASSFRLDLYYRLAVVVLQVPALRERREDIPLLVEAFARNTGFAGDIHELFSPQALQQLAAMRWPGNVRELQNVIESTIAMGEPTSFEPTKVPTEEGSFLPYRAARDRVLASFEREYLSALYQRTSGNASQAAREAQMDRSHLLDLLRKHGLRA